MDYSTYYLLLEDSCATQIGKIDQALLYVSAGSLWIINDQHEPETCANHNHSSSRENLYLKSCELINVYLSCPHKSVRSINEIEFELLLAVDSFAERKKISTESSILQSGREIYDRYLDQFVSGQMCEIFVTITNHPGLPDSTCGLIQYAGSLPSCPGIWFGIKLPFVYKGFGATDGSFKGKRFFECDENCGLFLSIDKISIYHPHKGLENSDLSEEDRSSGKSDIVSICEAMTCNSLVNNLEKLPLELGERIVWISDDGPELGTVRWIGILPDARVKEFMIGVEFDRPIGTGTGKYNNEQLFRTAQSHASLIPAIGLMKAEEFFGSKDDVSDTSIAYLTHSNANARNEPSIVPRDKHNFTPVLNLSDPSDVCSSGDSASQTSTYQSVNNQTSESVHRPVSTNISPSAASVARNVATETLRRKCVQSVVTLEHCYENVEKDETGRILNRDTNSFQVAVGNEQGDYLECHPHPTPTSFHRSFDNIYAENKKKKFSITNQIMDYDRVGTLKLSEDGLRKVVNDRDVRSRTLETYSTTKSVACKVFDENDVLLRLPYTTGRSTFYGRADDESLHANADNQNEGPQYSKNSKTHRSIFKFISKRTPNIILQQINKTLRNSFLPPSFHRRSSSDSTPTVPERNLTTGGSLIPFSSAGCSVVPCRQDDEREFCLTETNTLPCDGQTICLKTNNTMRADMSPSTPQSCETIATFSGDQATGKVSTNTSLARTAVTFQPRPTSSLQLERHGYPFSDFDIGSRVEVDVEEGTCYGVVRWMGCFKNRSDILVGLELEEEHKMGTDGKVGERRFFSCPSNRAYFTFISAMRRDSRLFPLVYSSDPGLRKLAICPPLCFDDLNSLTLSLNMKSTNLISTYNNADVILFSIFAFSQSFDSMLLRSRSNDLEAVVNMRRALLERVVNPLRCGQSVNTSRIDCIDRVDKASTIKTKSQIPVEGPAKYFLQLMQTLNADPCLNFSSGEGMHMWSVSVGGEGVISLPLQQLFELSFYRADVKLSRVPFRLVLHLQKQSREPLVPSMELDITDVLENSLRECNICGKLGTSECRDCFESTRLLSSTMFCEACSNQYHSHVKRSHHRPLSVETILDDFRLPTEVTGSGWADKFRERAELCAVVCSREFHVVGFVRTGLSSDAPWMFMSTRDIEDETGPAKVGICSFLPDLIGRSSTSRPISTNRTDMSSLMERFLLDADLYVYQFPPLFPYE